MIRKLSPISLLLLLAVATTYGGTQTHPAYTVAGATCKPNQSCNNANGCSWISHVYDYWYAAGACDTGSGGTGDCTMSWRLCNHHIDYDDTHCSIFNSEKFVYGYGC